MVTPSSLQGDLVNIANQKHSRNTIDPAMFLDINLLNPAELAKYDYSLTYNFICLSAFNNLQELMQTDFEKLIIYGQLNSFTNRYEDGKTKLSNSFKEVVNKFERCVDIKLLSNADFEIGELEFNMRRLIVNKFYGPYGNDQ